MALKQRELDELRAELEAERKSKEPAQAEPVVAPARDADWGKRGRGRKIIAWIAANGASVEAVMERFHLARSTSQRYMRQARKPALRIAA